MKGISMKVSLIKIISLSMTTDKKYNFSLSSSLLPRLFSISLFFSNYYKEQYYFFKLSFYSPRFRMFRGCFLSPSPHLPRRQLAHPPPQFNGTTCRGGALEPDSHPTIKINLFNRPFYRSFKKLISPSSLRTNLLQRNTLLK